MTVIWRVLLVFVTAFLAWRIASYGIGEYYVEHASEGDALGIDRALAWNPRHPEALYRKALLVRAKDPALASNLLKQSFAEKPSSAYPLLTLAGMAQESGVQDLAAALTEDSASRMPANPPIRIAAGG